MKEEKNEILTAMRDGFAEIRKEMANGFADVRQEMATGFTQVDQQFLSLRREFSEQLDGVSDGFHLELRVMAAKVARQIGALGTDIEKIDSKVALVGENVANVVKEIGRYHANVEVPLENRVTNLEGRVLALEEK